MLDKILEENNIDFKLALAWCLNAKNSLSNVHGFSPYQLAMGQNPKLPSTLSDKLPALSTESTNKLLSDNLKALHDAREAYIASESSEKIRRALSHNIRTSGDRKYITGDSIFFKRQCDRKWRGPAKVLGQDGQQVLIKYGSTYVRVHPCRITPARENFTSPESTTNKTSNKTNNALSNYEEHTQQNFTAPPISTSNVETFPSQNDTELLPTTDTELPTSDNCNESLPLTVSSSESIPKETNTINLPSTSSNTTTSSNNIAETSKASVNQLDDFSSSFENLSISDDKSELKLKKDISVIVKLKDKENPETVTLVSRSGKTTGKYKNAWNVLADNGKIYSIDFDRDTDHFTIISQEQCKSNNIERQYSDVYYTHEEHEIMLAKQKELNNWKTEKVYVEIDNQCDQKPITTRWVLTKKLIDSKIQTKARLCARGFEEIQDFRTDSPCCSRVAIRLFMTILASKNWTLNSIDVKTAFLQGKEIQRTVIIQPPPEANTNKLWKLLKCVYGLADASRFWYLRVKEELLNLNAKISNVDPSCFYWTENNILIGILLCHVDDMIFGGTVEFHKNVIEKLKFIFKFGAEESNAFKYVGIEISQNDDYSINIQQLNYIQSIEEIPIRKQPKDDVLIDKEKTLCRRIVGQLNWIAGISRPDVSFYICEASTKLNNSTISDAVKINKIVRYVKSTPVTIKFPIMNLDEVKLKIFCDASFNNLPNGGSQGGQIILLADKKNNVCPIYWNSTKIKRVARSTITAETLSLSDACDISIFLSKIVSELVPSSSNSNNIVYTDNLSLFEAAHSSKQLLEKRLIVDIASIREMLERKQIHLIWIEKEKQLADVLTKGGASSEKLLEVLKSGLLKM